MNLLFVLPGVTMSLPCPKTFALVLGIRVGIVCKPQRQLAPVLTGAMDRFPEGAALKVKPEHRRKNSQSMLVSANHFAGLIHGLRQHDRG